MKTNNRFYATHIVPLTIWHHLFLKFWLVDTWFFTHWRHQRAVTHLENVRQLNIGRGKKPGFQLSHAQPLSHMGYEHEIEAMYFFADAFCDRWTYYVDELFYFWLFLQNLNCTK